MHRDATALVVALFVLAALPAAADHDAPSKARGIDVDLVRAHAACTAPNDIHDRVAVFPSACSPAAPFSSYAFGPAGRGRAQVRRVANGIKLRFDVRDVRTAADAPVDGVEFAGRVYVRLTDDGCSAAPSCTLETFFQVSAPCKAGRCQVNLLYPSVLLAVGLGGAAEITQIDVLDDTGNRFATAGFLFP